jgi:serine/threonine protein kinase
MVENPVLNDRYRLIEQIGSGGMAVLYKAQDLELDRIVAVKVLRPSLVDDPEFLTRFKREARSAANLSHPNIVTVHDVGQDGPNTHYIVMEYVPGKDLKQLIREQGAFEVDDALAVVIEICKGVGYAHRAGLIHCDLKPQNILVTPENRIKVVDFGIARALSTTVDEETQEIVWGSPHYFSPEQAAGEAPTPASDVYSIGIILYELLTGELPFTGEDYQTLAIAHFTDDPPSILDVNPALPRELDRIIKKVLSKEPSSRYRTADQLGRILQKYRDQGQQPTGTFTVTPSGAVSPPPSAQTVQSAPIPPYQQSPAPRPRGLGERPEPESTIPSLPPLDVDRVMGRPSSRPVYGAGPYGQPAYEPVDYDTGRHYTAGDDDEEEVGPDVYGVVLSVLAAAAVLGLIPLWITVYLTLAR